MPRVDEILLAWQRKLEKVKIRCRKGLKFERSSIENQEKQKAENQDEEKQDEEKQDETTEETSGGKTTRNEYTQPGQTPSKQEGSYYREDDEDIAVIIPANFDLALEKWVSNVIRKD
ncbi:MAG: hypothetical protein IJJ65_01415, partial [Butyrivibrio sp.]|nr:hypothetical protein [Butyrivibrio sp.]